MKTSELTGAALDWAVCMAQGLKPEDIYISMARSVYASLYRLNRDEDGNLNGRYTTGPELLFSSKWEAGGPIIEREKLTVAYTSDALPNGVPVGWVAVHPERYVKFDDDGDVSEWHTPDAYGPTPLIAAMRCYVASKLGDEVEIPKELTA